MLCHVDLLGAGDLVELFGVSKTRVEQLIAEDGFPEAHRVGKQRTRVWERDAVMEWARTRTPPRAIREADDSES